jgi:hypothetical protein
MNRISYNVAYIPERKVSYHRDKPVSFLLTVHLSLSSRFQSVFSHQFRGPEIGQTKVEPDYPYYQPIMTGSTGLNWPLQQNIGQYMSQRLCIISLAWSKKSHSLIELWSNFLGRVYTQTTCRKLRIKIKIKEKALTGFYISIPNMMHDDLHRLLPLWPRHHRLLASQNTPWWTPWSHHSTHCEGHRLGPENIIFIGLVNSSLHL